LKETLELLQELYFRKRWKRLINYNIDSWKVKENCDIFEIEKRVWRFNQTKGAKSPLFLLSHPIFNSTRLLLEIYFLSITQKCYSNLVNISLIFIFFKEKG
jgi:hypothetical protein